MTPGLLGDLGRLGIARVVLPQPGVGRQVVLELGVHGQRRALAIDGQRRRAGRVDADADDVLRPEAPLSLRRLDRLADRLAKTLDVIGRVLPGQVRVLGIEQDAGLAARIVVHARRPLLSPSATSTTTARTLLVP